MAPLRKHEVCRSCTLTAAVMQPLTHRMEGDKRTLLEVLTFVTDLTISREDPLPQQVCVECLSLVRIADSFKRKCHNSEETLKNSLLIADNILSSSVKDDSTDYESKLSCNYCNRFFENVPEFSSHMQSHENPYQCSICLQRYPNWKTLESHLADSHQPKKNNVNKFECEHCEENFFCENVFFSHLKVCNDDANNSLLSTNDKSPDAAFSDNDSPSPISYTKQCKVEDDGVDDTTPLTIGEQSSLLDVKIFPCSKCELKFDTKKSSKEHFKEVHPDVKKKLKRKYPNKINNKICAVANKNATKEKMHRKINVNKKYKKETDKSEQLSLMKSELVKMEVEVMPPPVPDHVIYSCTMCERKFTKKGSFEAHLKKHEIQSKETHICSICKREFKHRAHLDNHILSVHSSDRGLKCDYCPKSFATQDSLDLHLVSHKDQKKHQCQICEKGFNMLSTLKDHMRTHTGEKPFLCSTCGRGFSQKTNLKEHMRRHAGYKPYKCNTCEHGFVSKGELVAHNRKHSGAHPFVCEECKAGFTTSSSLVKHRRIHSGERPYECGVCPMRFTALGTLKNHRRTHTGEKPYKCTYCEKAFAQKNDLHSHTRCHTGERPYVCSACGQSFRQPSALKTHLKLHALKDGSAAPIAAAAAAPAPDKQLPPRLYVVSVNPLSIELSTTRPDV